jgi:hypothetical protein
MRWALALAALAGTWALSGCVSTRIEPETGATFFVTRAGDTATLSWVSESDKEYTIMYTSNRSGGTPWQVVEGGAGIRGNGDQITFVEKVPPDEQRYYRVDIKDSRK